MARVQIKGKILIIGETKTFSGGFMSREIVVEEDAEQYPQKLKVEFIKDATTYLDHYRVGNSVEINANLRGNEYQGKHYVGLQGYNIKNLSSNAPEPTKNNQGAATNANASSDDDSGLPF